MVISTTPRPRQAPPAAPSRPTSVAGGDPSTRHRETLIARLRRAAGGLLRLRHVRRPTTCTHLDPAPSRATPKSPPTTPPPTCHASSGPPSLARFVSEPALPGDRCRYTDEHRQRGSRHGCDSRRRFSAYAAPGSPPHKAGIAFITLYDVPRGKSGAVVALIRTYDEVEEVSAGRARPLGPAYDDSCGRSQYSHVMPAVLREAAEATEAALRRSMAAATEGRPPRAHHPDRQLNLAPCPGGCRGRDAARRTRGAACRRRTG